MGNQPSHPNTKDPDFSKFAHFLPIEIKEWSSTFRSMFPAGYMTKSDFAGFFSQIFPFGKAASFSDRLFHTINICQTGKVDLDELLIAFTILFKGSTFERLRWIFRFYDNDKDGVVGREELCEGLDTINEMVANSAIRGVETRKLVDGVFEAVENRSGFLTFNDFEILASRSPENFRKLSFFCD